MMLSQDSPAWQPTGARPWPDQVNEELSRHGHGLEDHERRLDQAERRLLQLGDAAGADVDSIHKYVAGLAGRIVELERLIVLLERSFETLRQERTL